MRRKILGLLAIALAAPAFGAEGRTPIWTPGTVITAPGRYIVTRDLFGGGGPVIDVTVGDVDIDLNGMTLSGGGAAAPVILVSGVGDVVIHDGTLLDGGENVAASAPGLRLVLEDLKVDGSGGAGIHIIDNQNFVVRRVTISGAGAEGILVDGPLSKQGTIEDNLVRRTFGTAIRVFNGASIGLLNNRVEETAAGTFGIALETCESCLLVQNTVHATGDIGIFLRSFKGGKVYNNVVARAGSHGIFLDALSSDTLILNNVATGSLGAGSGLFVDGDRLMIEGNTLNANAGFGLRLGAGSSFLTFGRNTARGNAGGAPGPCAAAPPLFPPNSCNDGGGNTTFGNNLIPGPPVF